MRRALKGEADINFHFCSDPEEAPEIAQQISPTVILQDLVMPGTDGLTLVRAYRALKGTEQVPIIVLSSREEAKTKSDEFAVVMKCSHGRVRVVAYRGVAVCPVASLVCRR